jgi:carbon storage regulator
MLVLTRRCGEEIVIGGNIHVKVLSAHGGKVRIGITAPQFVAVDRQEVHQRRAVAIGEFDAKSGEFICRREPCNMVNG